MTDIESLRRLTEAVETAGADIAPTYLEYVQLSFAIATDCGEAGRDFFHRLCRVSPKYQREHAERVFSNALHTQRGEVHLGTAFHLAEATGVSICIEEMPKHPTGTKGTAGTARKFPTHTGAYNKVGNDNISDDREGEEELLPGSEPQHQLPTFPKNNWPEFLQRIIKAGSSPIQHDIMLLGALTALGACMSRHVRCLYADNMHPDLRTGIAAKHRAVMDKRHAAALSGCCNRCAQPCHSSADDYDLIVLFELSHFLTLQFSTSCFFGLSIRTSVWTFSIRFSDKAIFSALRTQIAVL